MYRFADVEVRQAGLRTYAGKSLFCRVFWVFSRSRRSWFLYWLFAILVFKASLSARLISFVAAGFPKKKGQWRDVLIIHPRPTKVPRLPIALLFCHGSSLTGGFVRRRSRTAVHLARRDQGVKVCLKPIIESTDTSEGDFVLPGSVHSR